MYFRNILHFQERLKKNVKVSSIISLRNKISITRRWAWCILGFRWSKHLGNVGLKFLYNLLHKINTLCPKHFIWRAIIRWAWKLTRVQSGPLYPLRKTFSHKGRYSHHEELLSLLLKAQLKWFCCQSLQMLIIPMGRYRKLCSLYVTHITLEVSEFGVCFFFRIWDLDFSLLPLRIPSLCILEDLHRLLLFFFFFIEHSPHPTSVLNSRLLQCYRIPTNNFPPFLHWYFSSLTSTRRLYIIQHKKRAGWTFFI